MTGKRLTKAMDDVCRNNSELAFTLKVWPGLSKTDQNLMRWVTDRISVFSYSYYKKAGSGKFILNAHYTT